MLTGSLAPKGAVVKVAGISFDRFEGTARVFDGEDGAMEAILAGSIEPGTVVVIRYEGPKGGPGMREMLAVTGAMKGAGRGGDCAGDRRPVLRRHPRVLHRPRGAPRPSTAAPSPSWPTATASSSTWPPRPSTSSSTRPTLARRRGDWKLPEPRYTSGVLAKYARLASGAEQGAITEA